MAYYMCRIKICVQVGIRKKMMASYQEMMGFSKMQSPGPFTYMCNVKILSKDRKMITRGCERDNIGVFLINRYKIIDDRSKLKNLLATVINNTHFKLLFIFVVCCPSAQINHYFLFLRQDLLSFPPC